MSQENISHTKSINVKALERCQLLIGLNSSQLQNLLNEGEIETYNRGEVIIQEGEIGDTLYIILEGKVLIASSCGVELATLSGDDTLASQYEGDFFGEMSLLDLEPRSATVSAHNQVKILKINRDKLGELFSQDRELQLVLFINIARILSRRLRAANIRKVASHKKT